MKYMKQLFSIIALRGEGQWPLREENKLGESYHCPQLTTWWDHPECSGKRWLQGEQWSRWVEKELRFWGEPSHWSSQSRVLERRELHGERAFQKVPLEYWVSSSVWIWRCHSRLEKKKRKRLGKELQVRSKRTITRSLQVWDYFLLYQSRQNIAILRPSECSGGYFLSGIVELAIEQRLLWWLPNTNSCALQWGQTSNNIGVWSRENFIVRPSKKNGWLMLKIPELSDDFQEEVL